MDRVFTSCLLASDSSVHEFKIPHSEKRTYQDLARLMTWFEVQGLLPVCRLFGTWPFVPSDSKMPSHERCSRAIRVIRAIAFDICAVIPTTVCPDGARSQSTRDLRSCRWSVLLR